MCTWQGLLIVMFPNDNAISTVVSAVLLLGILVCVAASVSVYYVPSWVRADEAEHLHEVFIDFTSIPRVIDDLVLANDTTIVRSQRLVLGSGGIPFVSQGTSWGTFGVSPEGSFTVNASVLMENLTEKTVNRDLEDGSANITGIYSVSKFYIDITKIQDTSGNFPATFQYITINFTNQSGKTEILIRPDENHPGEDKSSLQVSTWLRESDREYKIIDRTYINRSIPALTPVNYRIDLLNPCYGFDKVLSDATTPYNLTITNSTGIDGEYINYSIKYNGYNRTIEQYSKTGTGAIIYESENRRFINQRFIYQNGAIFLCQTPDVSMRTESGIVISDGSVTIPLISINSTEHGKPMVSGSGVEELQIRLNRADTVSFADGVNTNNVTITIKPPEGVEDFKKNYLDSWADHFAELVSGTSIAMNPVPVYSSNYTDIKITLNGSIHLTVQDVAIQGRVATITS